MVEDMIKYWLRMEKGGGRNYYPHFGVIITLWWRWITITRNEANNFPFPSSSIHNDYLILLTPISIHFHSL